MWYVWSLQRDFIGKTTFADQNTCLKSKFTIVLAQLFMILGVSMRLNSNWTCIPLKMYRWNLVLIKGWCLINFHRIKYSLFIAWKLNFEQPTRKHFYPNSSASYLCKVYNPQNINLNFSLRRFWKSPLISILNQKRFMNKDNCGNDVFWLRIKLSTMYIGETIVQVSLYNCIVLLHWLATARLRCLH